MCPATYYKPTTILTISNAACLDTRALRGGGSRERNLSRSVARYERGCCYADEKLLALLPDCIGSSAKLLKLLVINKRLKCDVRLTFSKAER